MVGSVKLQHENQQWVKMWQGILARLKKTVVRIIQEIKSLPKHGSVLEFFQSYICCFFCCFRISLFWCSRTYVRNKVGIYFSVSRSCCISSQRPMPSWTVPQIVKPLLALVSMSESPSPYVWGNMWAGDRHHWDGRNKTCVQGCFCCCFCIHTFSILSMQKCCHVVLRFCP